MREIVSCPVCGGLERTKVYESTIDSKKIDSHNFDPYVAHYQINRCEGCHLIFSSPILDDNEVHALYEKAPHTNVAIGEEENVRQTMRYYYNLARPFLKDRERVLDIGCDMGFLLEAARQDGFREIFGIEPNPKARMVAATVSGAVISDLYYEQQDFAADYFDLITLIHVLDHVFDPGEVLRRAWHHLKPGGVIFAVVHNVRSLLSATLGERFPVYNLYHHYFFSKVTFGKLFAHNEFEVLQTISTYNCYSLNFLINKLPGLPASAKAFMGSFLDSVYLGRHPLTLPLGNVGIVARRPS